MRTPPAAGLCTHLEDDVMTRTGDGTIGADRRPTPLQDAVLVVGFLVIGWLGFVVEGPWWRLALLAVVPYGLAFWLAGRAGRRAGAPRRS